MSGSGSSPLTRAQRWPSPDLALDEAVGPAEIAEAAGPGSSACRSAMASTTASPIAGPPGDGRPSTGEARRARPRRGAAPSRRSRRRARRDRRRRGRSAAPGRSARHRRESTLSRRMSWAPGAISPWGPAQDELVVAEAAAGSEVGAAVRELQHSSGPVGAGQDVGEPWTQPRLEPLRVQLLASGAPGRPREPRSRDYLRARRARRPS